MTPTDWVWILVIAAIPFAAAIVVIVDSLRIERRTREEKQERALHQVNEEEVQRQERVKAHMEQQERRRIRHLYHQ